jgi:hypothetical protein
MKPRIEEPRASIEMKMREIERKEATLQAAADTGLANGNEDRNVSWVFPEVLTCSR